MNRTALGYGLKKIQQLLGQTDEQNQALFTVF